MPVSGRLREAECTAQNGSLVWGKGELNSCCCVTCQALQQLLAKDVHSLLDVGLECVQALHAAGSIPSSSSSPSARRMPRS
ncbi:unnamed protein product [Natator depressus]